MKIIVKCNFDFQTCVNYQFFPFQDNFFGSSELRGGSQYWKFVIFLVCFRNLVIIFVMIFVIIFVIIFFLRNRAPGLVNSVPTVNHFCLNLPQHFSQSRAQPWHPITEKMATYCICVIKDQHCRSIGREFCIFKTGFKIVKQADSARADNPGILTFLMVIAHSTWQYIKR